MNIKNFFTEILHLGRHPLQRAQDQVKLAANKHARAVAEVKYQENMVSFYTGQATSLNPHTHWWEFAAAMECQKTHQAALEEERNFEAHLRNKLRACQERVNSLRAEGT